MLWCPPIAHAKSVGRLDMKFVTYEKRGHVGYITVNRPERLNAGG